LLDVPRREAAGGRQTPPVLSLIVSHPELLRGVLENLAAEPPSRA
jgi:hypothetical protein